MSYQEFRSWQLFYMLEPFGFENDEYRTAAQLAMLYNINKGKGKPKEPSDFMRDITKEVLKQTAQPKEMTRDELIAQMKKDFGI